jgi:hypothetical protein
VLVFEGGDQVFDGALVNGERLHTIQVTSGQGESEMMRSSGRAEQDVFAALIAQVRAEATAADAKRRTNDTEQKVPAARPE